MAAIGKKFVGARRDNTAGVRVVSVDGNIEYLNPRLDLANHSPTGFEWGYHGSGPAQLALAIVAEILPDDMALNVYQEFKRRVIAHLDSTWVLEDIDVLAHVQDILSSMGEPCSMSLLRANMFLSQ